MHKLFLLVRIELKNLLLNNNFALSNKSKKTSGYLLLLVPALIFLYISCAYTYSMITLLPQESQFVIPFLMATATFSTLFALLFSSASGHLYGFKDFDLLMSLPLTKNQVMASKLVSFMLLGYFYSFFLTIPYIVIYGIYTQQTILYYLLGFTGYLFAPMIPLILSSLLSFMIAKIASGSKYSSLINIILTLGMVFCILGFSMKLSDFMNVSFEDATGLSDTIKTYLPFVYYYGNALSKKDIVSLLIYILLSIVPFILFVYGFSKLFVKLNVGFIEGYKVSDYKMKELKTSGHFISLLKLHFSRYFHSTGYFVNTIVGPLMILIFVIMGKFDSGNTVEMVLELLDIRFILVIISGIILFCSSMCFITASSISLEGKYFYILKSSPLSAKEICGAKVMLQVIVCFVTSAIGIIMATILYSLSIELMVFALLLTLFSSFFFALFGLIINLEFPKMEWESEVLVVKQSMSSMITMFASMALSALQGYLFYLMLDRFTTILSVLLLFSFNIIFSILMWQYLAKYGEKKLLKI